LGNAYATWKTDHLVVFIRYCSKCRKYFAGLQEIIPEKMKPKNPNSGVSYSKRTDMKATPDEIRIAEKVKEQMQKGELSVTKK
jgi:hypothetical protein